MVEIEQTQVSPNGNPMYESVGGDGHIVAIPEDGEIYIPIIMAGQNTSMKELVTAVIHEIGTNKLCFTNVISDELKQSLDGFTEEQEYAEQYDEYVTVLRGEWDYCVS